MVDVFSLEHVEKGFILTVDGKKEIVVEEAICYRIGQLLGVAALKPEVGACVYRVESCRLTSDAMKGNPIPEGLMKAKLKFVHSNKQKDKLTVLYIKDKERYEVIGEEADEVALKLNFKIGRSQGISIVSFDRKANDKKLLSQFNPVVIEKSSEEIMEWYYSTMVPDD